MNMQALPADTILSAARRANLARLLAPRHIAFIGGKFAEMALRSLRKHDFAGEVYVVNPGRDEIAGHKCYRSLADLPVAPDASYLAVPAETTVAAVAELNRMGAGGVICYAAGFSEQGEAGAERTQRLIAAAGDLAVVGPNCYGLINYVNDASMWTSDYLALPARRGAAIVGQSGNVCIHLSGSQRATPFSYMISAGNQAVLGFEDYIDFLIDDPNVTCIGLFMEGIRSVPAFAKACLRARAEGMPVIICRTGTSELGAQLAVSHTSSLAGRNELYDALFRRLGVIATETVPQFLEMLKLASFAPPFTGNRTAVFSSSGGDNGLAADFLSAAGLALPQPTEAQKAAIAPQLPSYGHVSNPLDFTAGYWGAEDLLTPIFTALLSDGYDHGMIVLDPPPLQLGTEIAEPLTAMVRALAKAGEATAKPVILASVNPESISGPMREAALGMGVVPLQGLHDAGKVMAHWADYSAMRRADATRGLPDLPYALAPLTGSAETLNERLSKQELAAYGLSVPPGHVVTLDDLRNNPPSLDGPVALKVLDDRLPHKTEVGGVSLNLTTADELCAAAQRMAANVLKHAPSIALDSFLMEPMQPAPLAELIVGVKRDPLFGMVLVIGAGGILVELMEDARQLLLPVSRADIETELRQLRSFKLLDGFRGKPKADIAKVVDAICAIATYAADHLDDLMELDVNPLMVYADRAVAVDALIVKQTLR